MLLLTPKPYSCLHPNAESLAVPNGGDGHRSPPRRLSQAIALAPCTVAEGMATRRRIERGKQSDRARDLPIHSSAVIGQQFLPLDMFGDSADRLDPSDVDGWRAKIKATDELLIAVLGPQVELLRSTVESRSVNGVSVFVVLPDGVDDGDSHPIYLDIHGGSLVMGGGKACEVTARKMGAQVQMKTWAVDYRMPPDHPYPAPLDDVLAVYRGLLDLQAPERIVVGGGSAGGNLAAALMLRARDEGLPLPAALVLLTPEADLTESGDSFQTNLGIDCVLTASLADSITLYADGHDLQDPYLSPLFENLAAPFPPTFLQARTRDLFLSNAVRMHRSLRSGGVDAELHIFEAMPHGGFFGAPEDDELTSEIRRFLASHLEHM